VRPEGDEVARGTLARRLHELYLRFDRSGVVADPIERVRVYPNHPDREIAAFIAGLGGRDILPEQFVEMIKHGIEVADKGQKESYEMLGVRE